MTALAAVWREAIADAQRLALAEGEREAARVIAAIPHPELLPASPQAVRRFALLYAAVVARWVCRHWDLSRQIADLPGGPSFGRSLAPWEAWRLAWAQQQSPLHDPTASDWKDGKPPVNSWDAVGLLLLACLRPPHIQRRRPSVSISPQTRAVLADLARQAKTRPSESARRPRRKVDD